MRRHPNASRALALAVPRPATTEWQEWVVALVAVAHLVRGLAALTR